MRKLLLAFCLMAVFPSTAWAVNATAAFVLPETVVTAGRVAEPASRAARMTTVITQEDLESRPGDTLAEVLASLPGVAVRQTSGAAKGAVADIRGMGDTAVSNVLVLVDGVRLNAPDLSGADLSSIPASMIERIEVVRGPAGVAYGDGAVAGVIQVFTKKAEAEPQAAVLARAGSFGAYEAQASGSGTSGSSRFTAQAGRSYTDGFRANGFLDARDLNVSLGHGFSFPEDSGLDVEARLSFHEDEYGLPGPLGREEALSEEGRRETRSPDDRGETRDLRLGLRLEGEVSDLGTVGLGLVHRSRDVAYVLGYSPLIAWDEQESGIDESSQELLLDWKNDWEFLGLEQNAALGLELRSTDYVREEPASDRRHNSLVRSAALFGRLETETAEDLFLRLGARQSLVDGRFRTDAQEEFAGQEYWRAGDETGKDWNKQALEAGLSWVPGLEWEAYLAGARSFRTPNVDELSLADEDLGPQHGWHLEAGAVWTPLVDLSLSASVFAMLVEDEIYYGEDPETGERFNRNYDEPTRRLGGEVSAEWQATDSLRLWAGASYTDARFEDSGEGIPLVPAFQASAGVECEALPGFFLTLDGLHESERLDGNDLDGSRYARLAGYELLNLGARYELGNFRVFAGVRNLRDEIYATAGYSEALYPMPGRSWCVGLEWTF